MPQPLTPWSEINRNEDRRRLRVKLRERERVKQIVVGLTLRRNGTRGDHGPKKWSAVPSAVAQQFGWPVELVVDERNQQREAERLMKRSGKFIRDEKMGSNKETKTVQAKMTVDAVAAAVSLVKEYLDRQAQNGRENGKS